MGILHPIYELEISKTHPFIYTGMAMKLNQLTNIQYKNYFHCMIRQHLIAIMNTDFSSTVIDLFDLCIPDVGRGKRSRCSGAYEPNHRGCLCTWPMCSVTTLSLIEIGERIVLRSKGNV